jgi:hypothetical protein
MLTIGISMYGWSSTVDIAIKKFGKENVQIGKKNVRVVKQIKFWECWTYSSDCISGTVCSNNKSAADYTFVVLYLTYCFPHNPCQA